MNATLKPAAGLVLACLLASCASSPAVRTEIVEVPVEVTVPLRAELTADIPPPPRPPLRCTDEATGQPTLCNEELGDWLNAYDAALLQLRDRMARIRALQPATDSGSSR